MQATSKLRSQLPSRDRPLLRMNGHYLSVDAAMPTMNIQISSNVPKITTSERDITKAQIQDLVIISIHIHVAAKKQCWAQGFAFISPRVSPLAVERGRIMKSDATQ